MRFHLLITGINNPGADIFKSVEVSKLGALIADQAKTNHKKICSILDSVQAFRKDKSVGFGAIWIARWRWVTMRKDVVAVLMGLPATKGSANLLLALYELEVLTKRIEQLEAQNRAVPADWMRLL